MPTQPNADGSIDAFIASRLPAWLMRNPVTQLTALKRCLVEQQAVQARLKTLFHSLTPLDTFCAPLLQQALTERLGRQLDVRVATLRLEFIERFSPDRAELPGAVRIRTLQHSLLAAALHNFSHAETLHLGLSEGSYLLDEHGQRLALSARNFAKLCRALDLGGRYQAYLKAQLTPAGEAASAIATVIEQGHQLALEAALRLAAARDEISEAVCQQCLAALEQQPTRVLPVGLRVLGKQVRGAVVFELYRVAPGVGHLEGVLCWLPGDPQGAVTWQGSWEALWAALGRRFRLPGYSAYVQRLISERDRLTFAQALASAMAMGDEQASVELDGRRAPFIEPLLRHLRKVQLATLLDDAQVLAVPTAVEDSVERDRRLHFYVSSALDLVGLASFFVPGLGLPLLAIGALQVVDDVYEGYVDWQLGDRQAALEHAINVATNVVQTAATAGAGAASQYLQQRSAFVDALAPVRTGVGQYKLFDPQLPAYALANDHTAIGQHASVEGKARMRTHQAAYEVAGNPLEGELHIQHPQRDEAYAPKLRQLAGGTWRHELDNPQAWRGVELLRRLGGSLAEVDEQAAQAVLQATGYGEDRLRRLHVEEGEPPARLLDAWQRRQLHAQFPLLQGAAFEEHFALQQRAASPAERLLLRDFPGLTARAAREVVQQADELQVEHMLAQQRVPLALAEQARWLLRDSRLDRACAGLGQPAAVNADTERLAFSLLGRWLSWPDNVQVELREARSGALPLARMGGAAASEVRVIARQRNGYQAQDDMGVALPGASPDDSLMQALWRQLSTAQHQALGQAGQSATQLGQALALRALAQREQLAGLLGMAPEPGRVRPPVRLGDGRLGYPLSGRGQSSTEALRQSIRRLFPSFTDTQIENFIASAAQHGMTPWGRYFHLHDQLSVLENTLGNWRRESAGPVQAVRRAWVARVIRRAWQRQTRDAHGNFQLFIHGWRVGDLPSLPELVDFSHVTQLSLRNMSLLDVEPGFLQRFRRVRGLDLRGNLLTAVPTGIEQLVELTECNLSENHIALTSESSRRIATLQRLQVLDLHSNLLGRAPNVHTLGRLRHLNLRSTGLRALPQALLESPTLNVIDLRENMISELPDAVLQLLRRDPERVYLHDNPLSAQAIRQLRELLENSAAAVMPARVHQASLEDERLRWLHGVSRAEQARRLAQLDRLEAEAGAQDLFRFFADFSRSTDFQRQPQEICRRAWDIIEACELNGEVRAAVFQQAAGPRSCSDQMLLIFSALEVRTLVAQRSAGLQGMYAMRPLLRLGRELFRLDQVDRIASRHIQQVRARDAYTPVDDVEVHLAYRVGLAEPLSLPGQPSKMNHADHSGVTREHLEVAEREVWDAESRDALSRSLAERDFWRQYLQSLHGSWFEEMNAPFHERLELIFEQREQLTDLVFNEAVEAVKTDQSAAERALYLQLTRQAYDRHPS